MKRFPGKVVMAAIILSCGFVMQAEQSERSHQRQEAREMVNPEPTASLAAAQRKVELQSQRASW
jgi:hypothetical protein